MGLNNLDDNEIKQFAEDPEGFLKDKAHLNKVIGFDSAASRRFADILKYQNGFTNEQIQERLAQVAMVRLKDVDVYK